MKRCWKGGGADGDGNIAGPIWFSPFFHRSVGKVGISSSFFCFTSQVDVYG